MRKPYNSNEEKMAIIAEIESRGLILISDNGTLEGENFLEFQEPPSPDKQILDIAIKQSVTDRVLAENGLMQQEILELILEMGK